MTPDEKNTETSVDYWVDLAIGVKAISEDDAEQRLKLALNSLIADSSIITEYEIMSVYAKGDGDDPEDEGLCECCDEAECDCGRPGTTCLHCISIGV